MTLSFRCARWSFLGIVACLLTAAPGLAAGEKLSPFNMTLKPAPQSEDAGSPGQGAEAASDKTATEIDGETGSEAPGDSVSESQTLVAARAAHNHENTLP